MNNCQPNCGCKFEVDSSCVRYTAVNLGTTLINVGDTIETTIIKIDQAITNLQQTIINNNTTGSTLQISGPIDRVVKFGPVSNPLLPSQTIDNGTSIGINANPDSSNKVLIETSSNQSGLKVSSLNNGKEAIIASSQATGSIVNKGIVSLVSGSTVSNIGTETSATGASNINVGISSTAIGGTSNYSAQLKDGSETVQGGKFLKDTGSGKANWNYIYLADIQDYQAPTSFSIPIATNTILGGIKVGNGLSITSQGVLSSNIGQGTLNYIAKFTPDGYSIDDSQIIDDGTSVAIGSIPSANSLFKINATNHWFSLEVNNSSNRPASSNYGIKCLVSGTSITNTGIEGWATGATTTNIGGYFTGRGGTSLQNYGIYAVAANGPLNYAARLVDGTEGVVGRYLRNMTTDGEANWANITAADVSGVQGALTLTTTGSSGAATLTGNTLNIPQYSGGGSIGSGTATVLPRWATGGTTLEDSNLSDNGTIVASAVNMTIKGTPIGRNAGGIFFGIGALASATSGQQGIAIGHGAMALSISGQNNIAIGEDSLASNPGPYNLAVGISALQLTTGTSNTAIGHSSQQLLTTGQNNSTLGYIALGRNSTGNNNVAIGVVAGNDTSTTGVYNTAPSNSIFIGAGTKALTSADANQIVIGYSAVGNGSNTTTIGNTSTTAVYLHGNLNLKNTSGVTTQTVSQTKYLPITINGVTYKLLLAD